MAFFLNGLKKDTYDEFSAMTNHAGIMSFVRANKDKERGGIWFGNRQYAVGDFESTDSNILLDYNDTGGLDVNYDLSYDYEFYASSTDNGTYEKVLKLPEGTYTFLVESECNGYKRSGYVNVSHEFWSHTEFAINSEILYYTKPTSSHYYYICIPCKHPMAPWIRYRIKLVGSSQAKKKEIEDVHGTYEKEGTYGYQECYVIPCVTNQGDTIIINSADVDTTYCTTATTAVVSEVEVGQAYLLGKENVTNFIINTDDIDNSDKIVTTVLSDTGDTATTVDLENGIYRFKFTDAIEGGFSVGCSSTTYEYTGGVRENALLSLSIQDDYYEWSITNPLIYSPDGSVKVVADNYGGYGVSVPQLEVISGKVDDIDETYLSGVTVNGSSENVTIENNVADIQMLFSNAGFYNNSLVCAYYGSRDHNSGNWVTPLFTARVQDNNGFKCSIRFRLCAVDSEHRTWQSEYYFDSHNVDNDKPYQCLACLDFHNRNYGITPTSYGIGGNNFASMYDVFYTSEKNINEKGKEEWIVNFYKLHLTGYDMCALLVDWVMDGVVQFDFKSMGYRDRNSECISGSIIGMKWADTDERKDKFDSEYHFSHSLSVVGTFESVIGDKKVYYPIDYREGSANVEYSGLNTDNKTVVGAINELQAGGTGGGGLSSVTINNSSEGVTIENNNADLSITDWTEQINFLSGRVDELINSLDVNLASDGDTTATSTASAHEEIWNEINSITGQLLTLNTQVQNSKNTAYIDETGSYLNVYSKKTGGYTQIDLSKLGL